MASDNHQQPPVLFERRFPLKIRETPGPHQWTQVCKNKEWLIYGIMNCYAPFFLRNLMVTFAGLHYAISNQVPSQSPISKEGFSPSVLQSMASTRRPFEDPNALAFQVLGIQFQWYSPKGILAQDSSGEISRIFNHSNQWLRHKALQNVLDNSIGPYRWY
ncbi:hypothetical protein O181_005760 [Austropuccinia psidii MF-1]|uniref:Uncharacterized protein n=1 Tax=Austropuccinia psidii MF-1 TaxID=1389203 RepID=A0A9Q3GG56_9BASI|nr:hypothetical protein [Austropuccinia psidii MF-1]